LVQGKSLDIRIRGATVGGGQNNKGGKAKIAVRAEWKKRGAGGDQGTHAQKGADNSLGEGIRKTGKLGDR